MSQPIKLEWGDYNDALWALVPFGRYIVWSAKGEWRMVASFDGSSLKHFATRDQAKAGAQEDFERRLASCFGAAPPLTIEDTCGHVVQFVSEMGDQGERTGGAQPWRDRIDMALASIRAELSTANDDEE